MNDTPRDRRPVGSQIERRRSRFRTDTEEGSTVPPSTTALVDERLGQGQVLGDG